MSKQTGLIFENSMIDALIGYDRECAIYIFNINGPIAIPCEGFALNCKEDANKEGDAYSPYVTIKKQEHSKIGDLKPFVKMAACEIAVFKKMLNAHYPNEDAVYVLPIEKTPIGYDIEAWYVSDSLYKKLAHSNAKLLRAIMSANPMEAIEYLLLEEIARPTDETIKYSSTNVEILEKYLAELQMLTYISDFSASTIWEKHYPDLSMLIADAKKRAEDCDPMYPEGKKVMDFFIAMAEAVSTPPNERNSSFYANLKEKNFFSEEEISDVHKDYFMPCAALGDIISFSGLNADYKGAVDFPNTLYLPGDTMSHNPLGYSHYIYGDNEEDETGNPVGTNYVILAQESINGRVGEYVRKELTYALRESKISGHGVETIINALNFCDARVLGEQQLKEYENPIDVVEFELDFYPVPMSGSENALSLEYWAKGAKKHTVFFYAVCFDHFSDPEAILWCQQR